MTMEIINRFLILWASVMLRSILIGGIGLTLVWFASQYLSRISPRVMSWFYRLSYLKILLLFVWASPITLPVLLEAPKLLSQPRKETAPLEGFETVLPNHQLNLGSGETPIIWREAGLQFLFGLWILGVAFVGAKQWKRYSKVRQIRRDSRPVDDPALHILVKSRAKLLGCAPPQLAFSNRKISPHLLGLFRPLIVLPENFTSIYSAHEMSLILDHELAHLLRRDLFWLWLPVIARCLFFFHPVLWLAEKGWLRVQEMASDELALAKSQATPLMYAQALLKCAEQKALSDSPLVFTANSSATFKDLKARITDLFSYRCRTRGKRILDGFVILLVAFAYLPHWQLTASAAPTSSEKVVKKIPPSAITKHFKTFQGCFLLADVKGGLLVNVGGEQCQKPAPPCSTFKILHSIFGVDADVLGGPNTQFKWDGSRAHFSSWEKDYTLFGAFRDSVNWYFKKVARLVGQKRMQQYLKRLDFNYTLSSKNFDTFWFDGSFKINAQRQLELLKRLYKFDLPFSHRAQEIARELIDGAGASSNKRFGGKTGTCQINGKISTGWFVGHMKESGANYVFVTLIKGKDGAWGSQARRITKDVLKEVGLL